MTQKDPWDSEEVHGKHVDAAFIRFYGSPRLCSPHLSKARAFLAQLRTARSLGGAVFGVSQKEVAPGVVIRTITEADNDIVEIHVVGEEEIPGEAIPETPGGIFWGACINSYTGPMLLQPINKPLRPPLNDVTLDDDPTKVATPVYGRMNHSRRPPNEDATKTGFYTSHDIWGSDRMAYSPGPGAFTGELRRVVQHYWGNVRPQTTQSPVRFGWTTRRTHGIVEYPFERVVGETEEDEDKNNKDRKWWLVEIGQDGIFAMPIDYEPNSRGAQSLLDSLSGLAGSISTRGTISLAAAMPSNNKIKQLGSVGVSWVSTLSALGDAGWAFSPIGGKKVGNVLLQEDANSPLAMTGIYGTSLEPGGYGYTASFLEYEFSYDTETETLSVAATDKAETGKAVAFPKTWTYPYRTTQPTDTTINSNQCAYSKRFWRHGRGALSGTIEYDESPEWTPLKQCDGINAQGASGPLFMFYDDKGVPVFIRWFAEPAASVQEETAWTYFQVAPYVNKSTLTQVNQMKSDAGLPAHGWAGWFYTEYVYRVPSYYASNPQIPQCGSYNIGGSRGRPRGAHIDGHTWGGADRYIGIWVKHGYYDALVDDVQWISVGETSLVEIENVLNELTKIQSQGVPDGYKQSLNAAIQELEKVVARIKESVNPYPAQDDDERFRVYPGFIPRESKTGQGFEDVQSYAPNLGPAGHTIETRITNEAYARLDIRVRAGDRTLSQTMYWDADERESIFLLSAYKTANQRKWHDHQPWDGPVLSDPRGDYGPGKCCVTTECHEWFPCPGAIAGVNYCFGHGSVLENTNWLYQSLYGDRKESLVLDGVQTFYNIKGAYVTASGYRMAVDDSVFIRNHVASEATDDGAGNIAWTPSPDGAHTGNPVWPDWYRMETLTQTEKMKMLAFVSMNVKIPSEINAPLSQQQIGDAFPDVLRARHSTSYLANPYISQPAGLKWAYGNANGTYTLHAGFTAASATYLADNTVIDDATSRMEVIGFYGDI